MKDSRKLGTVALCAFGLSLVVAHFVKGSWGVLVESFSVLILMATIIWIGVENFRNRPSNALVMTGVMVTMFVMVFGFSYLEETELDFVPKRYEELMRPPQAGLHYARIHKEATGQHSPFLKLEQRSFKYYETLQNFPDQFRVAWEDYFVVSFNGERLPYYYERNPPEDRRRYY